MPSWSPSLYTGHHPRIEQLRLNFAPWRARVRWEGQSITLGYYTTREQAVEAEQAFKAKRAKRKGTSP